MERRNENLFTPEEAAGYLAVTVAQLDTLQRDFGLKPWPVGKAKVYWRKDLDACAYRIVGERVPPELRRESELRLDEIAEQRPRQELLGRRRRR